MHSPLVSCLKHFFRKFEIGESPASDFPEAAAEMPSETSNSEVSDAVRMY